jgi:hypothetical protein
MKKLLFFMLSCLSLNVFADQNIVNNCNNNIQTDPRVPPAGAYTLHNQDGSSNDVYTTGETKPYIVDNNCGSTSSSAAQPNVILTPRR